MNCTKSNICVSAYSNARVVESCNRFYNLIDILYDYPGCQHTLETATGSFSADNYPTYQSCSWSVTVKYGMDVFLEFTTLNIPDCSENQLEIYDGVDNTGSLLGTYCADNATSGNTLRSTRNNVYVILKSGNSNAVRFQVRYEAQEPITGNENMGSISRLTISKLTL